LLETDEFARQNALVRFYYRENPDAMTDEQWALAIEEIMWVLKFNGTIQDKK
jgi:hypothetical protein